MASIVGEAGSLMARCASRRSSRAHGSLTGWASGASTGIRHAVTRGLRRGSHRRARHRIIAALAGLCVTPGEGEGSSCRDPRWHGYLANIGSAAFRDLAPRVPETLDGASFLARYHGTTDLVTRIDPAHRYGLRTPTAHPTRSTSVTEWVRRLSDAGGVFSDRCPPAGLRASRTPAT